MNYEEVVKKVKANLKKADAGKVGEHVAVQFDVVGDGEGALYMEIENGKISVEPYEYLDHDIKVTASAEDVFDVTSGKIKFSDMLSDGRASGDGIKASKLDGMEFKAAAPAKKPAAKKTSTAAKKPAAKKPAVKKPAVKKAAPAKKPAAKKPAAKK